MSYILRRLAGGEMQMLSALLNTAFTGDPASRHFEEGLPKMWVDDDLHMERHFAVFEDGTPVGAVGIYPYDVFIGQKKLRFATVGNIGVLREYRGRGYMRMLMEAAMNELDALSVDVSRLGGLRTRYERYGYEMCGTNYAVRLSRRNAEEAYPGGTDISFRAVEDGDTDALSHIRRFYQSGLITCDRGGDRDLYCTLCAWKNRPYLAYKDGHPIGYLCASADASSVAEHGALDAALHTEMLCAWVLSGTAYEIRAEIYPWDALLCRAIGRIYESVSAVPATQCKILSWDRLADALLSLKHSMTPLENGAVPLGIDGWGSLVMEVTADGARAARSNAVPCDTVSSLDAARLLFGMMPPALVCPLSGETHRLLSSWLPLPFSWNGQDRV